MLRNPSTSLFIAFTALLGGACLTGCAASPTSRVTTITGDTHGNAAATEDSWAFESDQSTMTSASPAWTHAPTIEGSAPQATPSRTPAQSTMPIGMFGEKISNTGRQPQPQGMSNLAQISSIAEGACFDPAVDRTGQRLVFASNMHQSNSNLYTKSVRGTTITQLTSDPADDVMPCFNPQGNKIAFASNRAGKWDVYIMSTEGGPPIQFTNDKDHEIHPSWSADGRHIAYCKFNSQSGRWEIWVAEVSNPGVKRFVEYGMFPKWSPDVASSKILFQRPRQRGSRLHGVWTVDFVNGEAVNPTEIVSAANAATINPTWSPDGRRIAFVTILDPDSSPSDRPDLADIWVVNLDGSGRVKVTDGQFANFQPVWAGDGNIYFISNRSGMDNIWAVSTDRVIDLTSPGATGVATAPMP
jgi:TolB protein